MLGYFYHYLLLFGSSRLNARDLKAKNEFEAMIRQFETNMVQFGDPSTFEEFKPVLDSFCTHEERLRKSKSYDDLVEAVVKDTLDGIESYCLDLLYDVLKYSAVSPNIELKKPLIMPSMKLQDKLTVQEILKNLGYEYSLSLSSENDTKTKILTNRYPIENHISMAAPDLRDQMDVKTLAISIGDGTISSEVDLSGVPLEGSYHVKTGLFLIKAAYMAAGFLPLEKFAEVKKLHEFAKKIEQAVAYRIALGNLVRVANGYDLWELLVLEALRKLDVEEDMLFAVTFTGHAIALSIKKTGSRTFELNLFNSGAGIGNHGYVDSGSDRKYFPSKRYVNISLGDLKRLAVLRKLGEITAMTSSKAKTVEGENPGVYTEEHLYGLILSSLNDFESTYTKEDLNRLHLTSAQRSGTCAFRNYMVYLAYKSSAKFRHYKLLINKAIILVAAGKHDWKENEKPVVSRLLKYALENQSRSVLKMIKRDELQGLDPSVYFGETFEKLYEKVETVMGIGRPKEFRIDLNSYTRDTSLLDALIERGKTVQSHFDNFKERSHGHSIKEDSDYKEHIERIRKEMTKENFISQIDSLIYLVEISPAWPRKDPPFHLLTMVCNYVLWKVPIPTKDSDVWDRIFEGDEAHVEFLLKKIFDLAQLLLRLQLRLNTFYPTAYVSIMKLLAITHKSLTLIAPEFTECNPMPGEIAEMESNSRWYLFTDVRVHNQLCDMIEFFTGGKGARQPRCMNQFGENTSILSNYLKRFAGDVDIHIAETSRQREDYVYSVRYKPDIPPNHYFWRDLRLFLFTMKFFDRIPFGYALKNEYNVYRGCSFENKYPDCEASLSQEIESTPSAESWEFEQNLPRLLGRPSVETPKKKRMFKPKPDDYYSASFGLTLKSENIFFHVFNTKTFCYDRFETMFADGSEDFDWPALMYVGTQSICQSLSTKHEDLVATAGPLISVLKIKMRRLQKTSSALNKISEISENTQRDIKYVSGLLVLTSIIAGKADDPDLLEEVSEELGKFGKTCSFEDMHGKYMIYAALGYILSVNNLNVVNRHRNAIIKANYFVQEAANLLENEIDRKNFVFTAETISARAFESFMEDGPAKDDFREILPSPFCEYSIVDHRHPYLVLEKDVIFNLCTGISFKKGVRTSLISDQELNSIILGTGTGAAGLKFSSTKEVKASNKSLVTCIISDLSRPLMQIPNSDQSHSLLEVAFLKSGKNVGFMKALSNGITLYQIELETDEWSKLPLPAIENNKVPYNVFYEPSQNRLLFEEGDNSIWFCDGVFFFDTVCHDLIPLGSQSADSFVSPLAFPETSFVFRGKSAYFALFKFYSDQSGKPLWIRKYDDSDMWCLVSEEKFCISPDQDIATSSYIQNYLAVSNKEGLGKIIVPLEHYKVVVGVEADEEQRAGFGNTYLFQFSTEHSDTLKSSRLISLSSGKVPNPKSRVDTILLAYKYLIGRDYHQSFSMLRRVHQMEPFGDEELRLMGWILTSDSAVRDGSPESASIRSYTSYLVFQNKRLFNTFSVTGENNDQERITDPYERIEKWKAFWEKELGGESSKAAVNRYFERRSKVPVDLRFDHKTGRDFLSAFEERTWLHWLGSKDDSDDIERHLHPRTTDSSKLEEQPVYMNPLPAITDLLPRDLARNARLQFDLSEITLFDPSFLKKDFYPILHQLIRSRYSDTTAMKLKNYFMTWKNTSLHSHGKVLINAIRLKESEFESEALDKIIDECDSYQFKASCLDLYKDLLKTLSMDVDAFDQTLSKMTIFRESKIKAVEKKLPIFKSEDISTKFVEPPKLSNMESFEGLKDMMVDIIDNIPESVWTILVSSRELWINQQKELLREIMRIISGSEMEGNDTLTSRLRKIGKGTIKPSNFDVLHLYAHASSKRYFQYCPSVPASQYQDLHDLCTRYAVLSVFINDISRLINSKGDKSALMTELVDRRVYSDSRETVVVAYEAFINSRLSKEQVGDIQEMTSKNDGRYPNKVIQRMMSAGKTFVLGTILAFMKADKTNLSVLVVPRALFSSEASSLISRTINAFGSEGFSFSASRDCTEESLKSLNWIHETMRKARDEGKYLIINPEMVLTLHNKLIESVLSKSEDRRAEFEALQGILKILQSHGSAVFDEIDTTFDPTQDLNFPLEASSEQHGGELLDHGLFMAEIFSDLASSKIRDIADMSTNISVDDGALKDVRNVIVSLLVEKLTGRRPYNLTSLKGRKLEFRRELSEADLQEFFDSDYLKQDSKEAQAGKRLKGLTDDPSTKNILSVCRMTLNEFIKVAWSGNVNENYGVSPDVHYAIPYASAGVPKSGSEFSFRWFTYVRTFRMYMVLGLNLRQLKAAIRWLKNWAEKELDEEISLENSRAAAISFVLFEKSPFSLNPEIHEELYRYLESIEKHMNTEEYVEFLMSWIGEIVIPSVKFYDQQISTNAADFEMMFDSLLGYTGTMATVKILPSYFHHSGAIKLQAHIEEDIKNKLLADQTYKAIELPAMWEVIKVPTSCKAKILWSSLEGSIHALEAKGHPFNAVIDVGAYFKDETNEDVAKSLLALKPSALYFSSKINKLALIVPGKQEKILHTISRSSLEDLGLKPENRVTFYDQQHTTGVDIFQHDEGFALLIIGMKTTTRDFNQAVMRMRGFLKEGKSQKVVVLVPENVANVISHTRNSISLKDILAYMKMNMKARARLHNAVALNNILRAHYKKPIYQKFLNAASYEDVRCLAEDIWIRSTETPIAKQILPDTPVEFKKYIANLIDQYESNVKNCLDKEVLIELRSDALEKINVALSDSMNDYPKTVNTKANTDSDQMVENASENKLEVEAQVEVEVENQRTGTGVFDFSQQLDFSLDYFPEVHYSAKYEAKTVSGLLNLDKALDEAGFTFLNGLFDERIYLSTKFLRHFCGRNRGYIFHILWLQKAGDIRVAIIDETEVISWERTDRKEVFGYNAWLMTPLGHFSRPSESKPNIDDSLLASVLIYGGFTNVFNINRWYDHIKRWLGEGDQKAIRSMIFRTIITDKMEASSYMNSPLSALLEVPEEDERKVRQMHGYQVLNYIAGNSAAAQRYFEQLIADGKSVHVPELVNMALIDMSFQVSQDYKITMVGFEQGMSALKRVLEKNGPNAIDQATVMSLVMISKNMYRMMKFAWKEFTASAKLAFETFKSAESSSDISLIQWTKIIFNNFLKINSYIMSNECRLYHEVELERKKQFNIEVVNWLLESKYVVRHPEILTELPYLFGWSVFPSGYNPNREAELDETKMAVIALLDIVRKTDIEEEILVQQIEERPEIVTKDTIFSEILKRNEAEPSVALENALTNTLTGILREARVEKAEVESYLKTNGYLDRWPWLRPSSLC